MAIKSNDQRAHFACDMSAISPAGRQQHLATIKEIFGSALAIRQLANGYAFRLANEDTILAQAAAFIAKERLCCPFFGFAIEVEPEGGALWLSLTGREGVKPFIQAEIGGALNKAVAREAKFL